MGKWVNAHQTIPPNAGKIAACHNMPAPPGLLTGFIDTDVDDVHCLYQSSLVSCMRNITTARNDCHFHCLSLEVMRPSIRYCHCKSEKGNTWQRVATQSNEWVGIQVLADDYAPLMQYPQNKLHVLGIVWLDNNPQLAKWCTLWCSKMACWNLFQSKPSFSSGISQLTMLAPG